MTQPPRRSHARPLAILVALLLAAGVGGLVGVNAFSEDDGSGAGAAREGSGKPFSPPSGRYRLEIPTGVVEVPPPSEDEAIPSEIDLSLELEGKVNQGGVIKTGTLSGPAARGTYDAVGAEAARKYSDQYEGHPDQWGSGAEVDDRATKIGGRDAIEITTKFSPGGDATPSVFFRIYFVDAPSGPPLLITCDWNTSVTEDIAAACETLVSSFDVTA
jgi:hypothetical protein